MAVRTRDVLAAIASVGVIVGGVVLVRSCLDFAHTASGGCPPEAEALNAACRALEHPPDFDLTCSSATGNP